METQIDWRGGDCQIVRGNENGFLKPVLSVWVIFVSNFGDNKINEKVQFNFHGFHFHQQ